MSKNEKDQGNSKYPSKLLKLREWLTVPEAAQHLSNLLGEEVTEADVLRLGLDGQMQISINIVEGAKAYQGGRFIPFKEWENEFRRTCSWETLEATVVSEELQLVKFNFPNNSILVSPIDLQLNLKQTSNPLTSDELKKEYEKTFSQDELLSFISGAAEKLVEWNKKQSEKYEGKVPPNMKFSKKVEQLRGVWDLAMLGDEKRIVENEYQELTDGPKVSTPYKYGILVKKDDILYQIQEAFQVEELIYRSCARYYPTGIFPYGSVLVVRASTLHKLQGQLLEDNRSNTNSADTLVPSERNSLIKMVFAMAVDCYGYDPIDKKSPVTMDILKAAAQADMSISADTVRKWLKEGAKLRKDDF